MSGNRQDIAQSVSQSGLFQTLVVALELFIDVLQQLFIITVQRDARNSAVEKLFHEHERSTTFLVVIKYIEHGFILKDLPIDEVS
jgi:hypothetical protein